MIDSKTIIEAIHEHDGIVSRVASDVGCTIKTIYNRRDSDPEVAAALTEAKDAANCDRLDNAERKLDQLVDEGYFPAIKYLLSTLGKSRGYTERTEVEHSGEIKQIIVNMDLTLPKDDDDELED